MTLDELGPWTGPATKPVRRTVQLTKSTKIQLDTRAPDTAVAGGWLGGFETAPLRATDVHPGDFATVTGESSNGRLVADSIAIVRPSAPPPTR